MVVRGWRNGGEQQLSSFSLLLSLLFSSLASSFVISFVHATILTSFSAIALVTFVCVLRFFSEAQIDQKLSAIAIQSVTRDNGTND